MRGYLVETDDRAYEADQVVIATGPFQTPRIPSIAPDLAADGATSSTAATTADPATSPTGPVLVVGGGNTGFQIAHELAATHEVHLAIGSRQTPLPQRLFGRDLFTILTATGLMGKTVDSRIGRRLSGRDALIGSSPRAIRRRGVHVRAAGDRRRRVDDHVRRRIDARRPDRDLGDGLRRRLLLRRRARLRRRRSRASTRAA